MSQKKVELGQFFTKKDLWLTPHIQKFIASIDFDKIVDPFAGGGNLLTIFDNPFKTQGYDIDPTLNWPINDSLRFIPNHKNDLCITNPPYLSKSTATRFNRIGAQEYFDENPGCEDLYFLGIEKCLESFEYGVAIIPETYQISNKRSNRLRSVTILEENPFEDTDFPVVVITWGPDTREDYEVYKNHILLGTNKSLLALTPKNLSLPISAIKFNDPNGSIGIKCIDGTDGIQKIRFVPGSDIKDEIKGSSRTATRITVAIPTDVDKVINESNRILNEYRKNTHDAFLAPFKGNDKNGNRRRRLDFKTARNILENALVNIVT